MLIIRKPSQKNTYGNIPFCEMSRIGTSIQTESRLVEEKWKVTFFPFGDDENVINRL